MKNKLTVLNATTNQKVVGEFDVKFIDQLFMQVVKYRPSAHENRARLVLYDTTRNIRQVAEVDEELIQRLMMLTFSPNEAEDVLADIKRKVAKDGHY